MIKSITAMNFKGESIKMVLTEPWDSGFLIESVDGLGPPKANINITDIAGVDGGEFNSARADTRNVVLSLRFMPPQIEYQVTYIEPKFEFPFSNEALNTNLLYFGDISTVDRVKSGLIEDVRLKSYQYFPIKKPITLLVETDNRSLYIDGYVETNEPDIFSNEEGCQVSIICPQPFFYSENNTAVISGVEKTFSFPFCNNSLGEAEIVFGHIQNNRFRTVTYLGDTDGGVIANIHITEDMTAQYITIVNNTFNESMVIDTSIIKSIRIATEYADWLSKGHTTSQVFTDSTGEYQEQKTNGAMIIQGEHNLFAGDDILISTENGNKYITYNHDATLYNVLNSVARGTKWIKLYNGDNVIGYTAYSIEGTTKDYEDTKKLEVKIGYKDMYEGV